MPHFVIDTNTLAVIWQPTKVAAVALINANAKMGRTGYDYFYEDDGTPDDEPPF